MSNGDNASGREAEVLDLLVYAGALKRLPRQGWVHLGIPDPESVADHSYRVALMTLLLAHSMPEVDASRALTLAICHDLPEAIAGDATPFDETLQAEEVDRDLLFRSRPVYSETADQAKRAAEEAALQQMTDSLPGSLRALIVDAWQEYEDGHTAEARLVRQLDKLEALLQGQEYQASMPDLRIESFEIGARERVTDAGLRRLLDAIVSFDLERDEPPER